MDGLNQLKDIINHAILHMIPDGYQQSIEPFLPQYWQEWILPVMGIPFFLIFLLEWRYQKSQGRDVGFGWRRTLTNFSLGGSYLFVEMLMQALIILPICLWIYQFRWFTIEVNWLTALPIFVAVEFCYYWFHRASHRINWFWSAHVVHHSDDQMNLSTAMRQSLLYSVTSWWIFFTPLMLLGVHPIWVFFFYAIDLIYQFFIHTETIGKLPRWAEYWLDTPSNHRAHHGTNPEYIDKNYGGVLIIFDRMFGTYVEEDENNPVRYGAVGEKTTDNIFFTIFSVFGRMWQSAFTVKGIKNKFKCFVAPPENQINNSQ